MRFAILGSTFGLAFALLVGCAADPVDPTPENTVSSADALRVTPAAFDACNAAATEAACVKCCATTQAATDIATCDLQVCVPKGLAGHP
jgi:hypothetical protein